MEGSCSRSSSSPRGSCSRANACARFSSRLSRSCGASCAGAACRRTFFSRSANVVRDGVRGIALQSGAVAFNVDRLRELDVLRELLQVQVLPAEVISRVLVGSAELRVETPACALIEMRGFPHQVLPRFVQDFFASVRKTLADGGEEVLYESGEDLVRKTPHFYQGASRRLDAELGGAHKYARDHFGGQHLYLEELTKNIEFAQAINVEGDGSALKRNPPNTITDDVR